MKNLSWLAFCSRAILPAILALSCAPLPLPAQTSEPVIGQIRANGSARFAESQISQASGLKPNQPADDRTLAAAADQLAATGAFSEVSYRYTTTNGKRIVTFHVVDEPKTLTCEFDNFVWVSPEELARGVREEVPLYDGRVTVDGSLPQAVATAAEHVLARHHVGFTVSYTLAAKTFGATPTAYRYSATGNLPVVSSVDFAGGPLEVALFAVAKQRLIGRPFSLNYAQSLAANDLDGVYQNHAYLRAHFGDPQVTFVPGTTDAEPGSVRLVFTVVPGLQYSWHGADWNGNSSYSSADLDHSLGMKEGDPAALDKISAGMDAISEMYGKKGYVALALSPRQSFDDAAHLVHYTVHVDEGSQFHMGALAITGFDDKTAQRIRKAWRLKSGEIFDASYLKDFGKKDLPGALADSPAAVKSGQYSLSSRPNPSALTVDVDVSMSTN